MTPTHRRSWLYDALSGPLHAPPPQPLTNPPPNAPNDGKAASVRIRLHGTPAETTATLAALTQVLDIQHISRPYPDRPPSTRHRIYLDATPRKDTRK